MEATEKENMTDRECMRFHFQSAGETSDHLMDLTCVSLSSNTTGIHSIEAWTQPASWKKTTGDENRAYFHESWKEERLSYLSTYSYYNVVFLPHSRK